MATKPTTATFGMKAAWAGMLILALAAAPGLLAGGGATAVVVKGVTVAGSGVSVELANTTQVAVKATIAVRGVLEDGTTFEVLQSIALPPQGTGYVPLGTPGPAQQVVVVGVVLDDGAPF